MDKANEFLIFPYRRTEPVKGLNLLESRRFADKKVRRIGAGNVIPPAPRNTSRSWIEANRVRIRLNRLVSSRIILVGLTATQPSFIIKLSGSGPNQPT